MEWREGTQCQSRSFLKPAPISCIPSTWQSPWRRVGILYIFSEKEIYNKSRPHSWKLYELHRPPFLLKTVERRRLLPSPFGWWDWFSYVLDYCCYPSLHQGKQLSQLLSTGHPSFLAQGRLPSYWLTWTNILKTHDLYWCFQK